MDTEREEEERLVRVTELNAEDEGGGGRALENADDIREEEDCTRRQSGPHAGSIFVL